MKKALILTSMIVIASSCSDKSINNPDGYLHAPDIVARTENGTKTSLQVNAEGIGTINWNPADEIKVFFGENGESARYVSQNTEDSSSAEFKTSDRISTEASSSIVRWGLYPYYASATINGGNITTSLPSTQKGVPDTFDKNVFISVSQANGNSLNFKNVCGGIKFTLSRDDVKSITITGNRNEALAGKINIQFGNDDTPSHKVVSEASSSSITITPKTGNTFAKDRWYYIVLLPQTFTDGIRLAFETESGTNIRTIKKEITIKRSVFAVQEHINTIGNITDKTDPKIAVGYVMYSDGTFDSPADYASRTGDRKTVAGVVYHKFDPKSTTTKAESGSQYINGLVVALKDIFSDDFPFDSFFWSEKTNILANKISEDINLVEGHSATEAMRKWNADNPTNRVLPVKGLDNWSRTRYVPGTSGWYIPSIKELDLMFNGDRTTVMTPSGSNGTLGFDKEKIDGLIKVADVGEITTNGVYWSSSESSEDKVWCLGVNDRGIVYDLSKDSQVFSASIRPVCAF